MSRRAPDEVTLGAIVAQLRATSAVTSTATGGSFTEVPQGTPEPYNKVTAPTGTRFDTYGRFGKQTLVDVDAVTIGASQAPGLRQRDAVIQALDFQRLTMSGHTMLGLAYESDTYFPEMVNAIKTHHHVASFRVWTEQSST